MPNVTFINNTTAVIHVRLTNDGEAAGEAAGDANFFDIPVGGAAVRVRNQRQVAFVFREDAGYPAVFMAQPGLIYPISKRTGEPVMPMV
ncbi:hypothetical protein AcW1_003097 [Taiwanofungus camphoratus]|nr:hypothetical protein AcV5_001712 [Antrodia cinnamomea]KAI0919732.1 hypothetical protein AcV5_001712 [Antrodia cinnamomea]KAI0919736.1 hypothetical protein AcV5_001715 [Antrodia cinnamomea]KAI0933276.1 hypothetical protein AcV7_004790 [Antrodia cinnamomea]KAI0933279.1 hypothetical protein AcV7_004794 [Antrodia cinnamomea]